MRVEDLINLIPCDIRIELTDGVEFNYYVGIAKNIPTKFKDCEIYHMIPYSTTDLRASLTIAIYED